MKNFLINSIHYVMSWESMAMNVSTDTLKLTKNRTKKLSSLIFTVQKGEVENSWRDYSWVAELLLLDWVWPGMAFRLDVKKQKSSLVKCFWQITIKFKTIFRLCKYLNLDRYNQTILWKMQCKMISLSNRKLINMKLHRLEKQVFCLQIKWFIPLSM